MHWLELSGRKAVVGLYRRRMADVAAPLGDPAPADLPLYALGALVYAERGDQILLLRRAGGVLAGQWYLPGGAVEAGETPEQGAIRELAEESGLSPDGDLQLVGVYPVWQYGREWLHVSYRCKVRGDVVLSDEHHEAMWIKAADMRSVITDDFIADLAAGNHRVTDLVRAIRDDLDRYLRLGATV
jgi:8-oxo-dGTP pyrophosphatase MutT (NUDIX family)